MAFREQEEAERVRPFLVDGGYDDEDVHVMDTARVLEGSSADLEHLSPFIKALGTESQIMESQRPARVRARCFSSPMPRRSSIPSG